MTDFFNQKHRNTILVSFFNNFYAGMMNLILIGLQISFMISLDRPATDTALLISLQSFGTLFTMYFAGSLSDKVGRKNLMMIGIGFYLVYIIGFLTFNNFNAMIVFSILAGIGSGLIDSPGKSLIFDAVNGKTGPYLSVNQVFFSAGTVLSTTLASLFTLKGWSWKNIYVFFLVITVMYLIVLSKSKFPPVKRFKVKANDVRSSENLGARPIMMVLLIIMLLFATIQSVLSTWLPQLAMSVKNMSEASSVSLLTYYQVGGILGAILIGRWLKKIHTTTFMIISPLVVLIVLNMVVFMPINTVMGMLVLILGFFLAIYYAYCINMGGLIYPNNTGAASGAVGTMFMFGQTITITLSTFFVKRWDLLSLFIVSIVLVIVLLLFATYFKKRYFMFEASR